MQVEVHQVTGRGEGVLRVAGQLLRAVFPGELPQGARVPLRVVAPGPPLVLQLPDPARQPIAGLLTPPSQPLTGALAAFLGAVPPEGPPGDLLRTAQALLRLPAATGPLARGLAVWMVRSGLFHEAQLARGSDPGDLKSLLLRLLPQVSGGPLQRAATSLLGHLEAHQARSVLEGQAILPLVLPWGEEWLQGELRLERDEPGRRAGGRRGGSLVVQLDMPELGRVEVRVRWGEPGVAVRLAAEPRGVAALREHLGELEVQLTTAAGVRLVDLRAEPLAPPALATGSAMVEVLA
ncbi:MAG: flagellar hook-length control protein FliK [Deferrisomatales bacterium]|nr:flagellar hook-length control protein FliK [Deferrisomatales bacterium]